jgi:tyramine---L-glutamate ligase
MSVFIQEYFCSGAFDGDLSGTSLAREGLAMLAAVVEDFSSCDSLTKTRDLKRSRDAKSAVLTTLDRRLRDSPRAARICELAEVVWVESPFAERKVFEQLAGRAEATLAIAPETGGLLLERRRRVDAAGGRFLGPTAEAIAVCSDKLRFDTHLNQHSIPTIPTLPWDFPANSTGCPFPIVLKPRDGAGSTNTFLIRDQGELRRGRKELVAGFADEGQEAIVQPYVEGRALSVAALIGPKANDVEIFPLAEQRQSGDGRFRYLGGRIPAPAVSEKIASEATQIVTGACRSLPGLFGYVGFDLIVTDDAPRVRIVELNPRLTTSYVGYRRLTGQNLAARLLLSRTVPEPNASTAVRWDKLAEPVQAHQSQQEINRGPAAATAALSHLTTLELPAECVEFDADGEVRFVAVSQT